MNLAASPLMNGATWEMSSQMLGSGVHYAIVFLM
jgi:hypothetical protein